MFDSLGAIHSLIQWFKSVLGLTPEMTIAFAHGTFNIANTIVQFPFIGVLAYLVTKIIPGEDEINKYEALYLDRLLITQHQLLPLVMLRKIGTLGVIRHPVFGSFLCFLC